MNDLPETDPRFALAAWPIDAATVEPVTSGLINRTWCVTAADGRRYALQRVNPLFAMAVNDDIDVVTAHLAAAGVMTPRVVRTHSGATAERLPDGVWRVITWIEGVTLEAFRDRADATAAGALLGRFHAALATLEHAFSNPRLGVHDTDRHLALLREALASGRGHREWPSIAPLGEAVLERAAALPQVPATPDRIVHGDPKITNVLFAADRPEALCLVDLDTVGRMPLPLELGDALRSWCNPVREDAAQTRFDVDVLEASMAGYFATAGRLIGETERAAILPATRTIVVELAARFCADALNERYFAWDPARYPSASAHHQARTRAQLALADSLAARAGDAEAALERAFANALRA